MQIGAKGIENLFNTFIICDYNVEKKNLLKDTNPNGLI